MHAVSGRVCTLYKREKDSTSLWKIRILKERAFFLIHTEAIVAISQEWKNNGVIMPCPLCPILIINEQKGTMNHQRNNAKLCIYFIKQVMRPYACVA